MNVGDPVRFRNMDGNYFDATIAVLNVVDGELVSCDLDLPIPARVVAGVEQPARVDRLRSIKRDIVPDGVHQPFTWLPIGEMP